MRKRSTPSLLDRVPAFLNQRLVWEVALLVLVAVVGMFMALTLYKISLGFGDESTFYEFAKNLSRGEVIYKDFIHFRTPGSYFLQALSIHVFGEQQSSVALAIYLETLVLYPLTFMLSAILILRKKSFAFVLAAYAGIVLFPAISQLRAGFALLTIAVYLYGLYSQHKNRYIIATGVLAGITFCFGQETAVMAIAVIGIAEILRLRRATIKARLKSRIAPLLGGFLVGVLPLLVYTLVNGSTGTFLYYTLYYSFIQQPKFMNLPFPPFGMTNLAFYVPFIIYGLCFALLFMTKKLGWKSGILLSFGILRLITLLGRSDMGHLVFSVGEVFLIAPYFIHSIVDERINKRNLLHFLPFAVLLLLTFTLAIQISSTFLIFAPLVILGALVFRKRWTFDDKKTSARVQLNAYFIIAGSLLLFIYLLYPTYKSTLQSVKAGISFDVTKQPSIGGVGVDSVTYSEAQSVKSYVDTVKPDTIFAFPIQPYYYSLAPHHASRYITFEPETTVAEQHQTISDLEKNKPGVIVFDPQQAESLSGAVWLISDYIMTHYQVQKIVQQRDILWVMTPRAADNTRPLLFDVFHTNKSGSGVFGIQTPSSGLMNAIAQSKESVDFTIENNAAKTLKLSVVDSTVFGPDLSSCGVVVVTATKDSPLKQKVCSVDGVVSIQLPTGKDVSVKLHKTGNQTVIWNSVVITD